MTRIEKRLADLKARQESGEYTQCPRCGLPTMKKDMSVQEYRSRLFSRMFERYVAQHHITDIFNRVTTIEGVAENYYFHIIARRHHLVFADTISANIQKDFGKPDD